MNVGYVSVIFVLILQLAGATEQKTSREKDLEDVLVDLSNTETGGEFAKHTAEVQSGLDDFGKHNPTRKRIEKKLHAVVESSLGRLFANYEKVNADLRRMLKRSATVIGLLNDFKTSSKNEKLYAGLYAVDVCREQKTVLPAATSALEDIPHILASGSIVKTEWKRKLKTIKKTLFMLRKMNMTFLGTIKKLMEDCSSPPPKIQQKKRASTDWSSDSTSSEWSD